MHTVLPTDVEDLRQEFPAFAKVGEQAIIPCGVEPGRALQQYRVTWYNMTDNSFISIADPRQVVPNSRYFVDPENFSLIIDDAEIADAGDFYRCVVSVNVPDGRGTVEYTQTRNIPLKLIVYSKFEV